MENKNRNRWEPKQSVIYNNTGIYLLFKMTTDKKAQVDLVKNYSASFTVYLPDSKRILLSFSFSNIKLLWL